MPYLEFTNVNSKDIETFLKYKVSEFSEITNAPLENIYIVESHAKIVNKELCALIKIDWMPRDKEVEVSVTEMLKDFFRDLGYVNIVVYFTIIDKNHYYVGEL